MHAKFARHPQVSSALSPSDIFDVQSKQTQRCFELLEYFLKGILKVEIYAEGMSISG
jgi:hypothetical protein